jgi:hypothetical protein
MREAWVLLGERLSILIEENAEKVVLLRVVRLQERDRCPSL